jgi:hypothetical protein
MIYPLPTQPPPLDPPKPKAKVADHVPYPAVTTGRGVPARIAPIGLVKIGVGQTHQLEATLLDCVGNEQQPIERFRFTSNNPRIQVSDSGLLTTNLPPQLVSRSGTGETGIITITYGSTIPVSSLVNIYVSADRDHLFQPLPLSHEDFR